LTPPFGTTTWLTWWWQVRARPLRSVAVDGRDGGGAPWVPCSPDGACAHGPARAHTPTPRQRHRATCRHPHRCTSGTLHQSRASPAPHPCLTCSLRHPHSSSFVYSSFSAFARWRGGGSHRLLHWNRVNHANPSARQADDSTAFRMMNMCCSGIISPTWWKGLGLFYASLATRSFGMGPGTF